jgi:hypothetical protein
MKKRNAWFCYDPDGDGIMFFPTAEGARLAAQKAIESCKEDGEWTDGVQDIVWGQIRQRATENTQMIEGKLLYDFALANV